MHIVLIAIGSRGDVEPCVALGRGLLRAGFRVTVILPGDLEHVALDHGVPSIGAPFEARTVMTAGPGQRWITEASGSRAAEARHLTALMDSVADLAADTIELVPDDADLVISGALTYDGTAALAQHRGIRHILALLLPVTPTRNGASTIFAALPNRKSRLNTFSAFVGSIGAYRVYHGPATVIRERLGMPPGSLREYFATARDTPALLATSPSLVPAVPEWNPQVFQTGHWHLPAVDDWAPPQGLSDFLDDGPAPVYLGFGSMTSADAQRVAEQVVAGVRRSGVRALIGTGWSGVDLDGLLTSADAGLIAPVGETPHDWLFARVAGAVHHGGAGTTVSAARSGIPQWVVPHLGDQPYWGRRVAAIGIGPDPVPQHRLDAEHVRTAVRRMTTDTAMRDAAARVGHRVRAERGVARAVGQISRYLG